MPCVECPHCQARARLADLRLPAPGGPTFYVRFADTYRLARGMTKQPAKLIREANPGLTAERVKWYRRRCVELGLLPRTRDGVPTPAAAEAPAVELHPTLAMILENNPQTPITVQLIRLAMGASYPSEAAAAEYLQQLQDAGLVPVPASA